MSHFRVVVLNGFNHLCVAVDDGPLRTWSLLRLLKAY